MSTRMAALAVAFWLAVTGLTDGMRVLGAAPEPLLAASLAVAVHRGARSGAVAGFALGLFADLFLLTPFGLSALAWSISGWLVGSITDRAVRASHWIPMALVVAATPPAMVAFGLAAAVVGETELAAPDRLLVALGVTVWQIPMSGAVVPLVGLVDSARPRPAAPGWVGARVST